MRLDWRKYYRSQASEIITGKYNIEVFIITNDAKKDQFSAMGFIGKKKKYEFYYRYKTEEKMMNGIKAFILRNEKNHEKLEAIKEERRCERKKIKEQFLKNLKVGDIFVSSWGYEQTNVFFYQVIEVKNSNIKIREISHKPIEGSEGFMSEKVVAVKDSFIGEEMTKRIVTDSIKIEHQYAYKWDGKPEYRSWYY